MPDIIGEDEDVENTFSDELLVMTLSPTKVEGGLLNDEVLEAFNAEAFNAGKALSQDMLGILVLCAEKPLYNVMESLSSLSGPPCPEMSKLNNDMLSEVLR